MNRSWALMAELELALMDEWVRVENDGNRGKKIILMRGRIKIAI